MMPIGWRSISEIGARILAIPEDVGRDAAFEAAEPQLGSCSRGGDGDDCPPAHLNPELSTEE
jgi:hypothetical protein